MFKDYGFCYQRNINLSVANKIIDQKKKKTFTNRNRMMNSLISLKKKNKRKKS